MGYLTLVAPIAASSVPTYDLCHQHCRRRLALVALQKLQVFFIGWRLAVAANNNEANKTAVTREKSIFTPKAGDEMVEEML